MNSGWGSSCEEMNCCKAWAAFSNSALSKPLAAVAIACPASTPTGLISMPRALAPRPEAMRGTVPKPANGSSTADGFVAPRQRSTRVCEKLSLYFNQRNPGSVLFPWWETILRVNSGLTNSREANRPCKERRSTVAPPLGDSDGGEHWSESRPIVISDGSAMPEV